MPSKPPNHRPLTGKMTLQARKAILPAAPDDVEAFLVHGWDKLERAQQGERLAENLSWAERRAQHARALAEALPVGARRRRQALQEVEALLAAIATAWTQPSTLDMTFEEAVETYLIEPLRAAFRTRRSVPC